MTNKPFAPSADRNKAPILAALKAEVSGGERVLEIGSGTGQHACFFASALPDISWQPTELEENLAGIESWLDEYGLANVCRPKVLDANSLPWPFESIDICYTSNTFHIVSMDSVHSIFKGASAALRKAGKLCVYGPFSISGQHTSESNELFDKQLRASDPASGIRDLSVLDDLAQKYSFAPSRRINMPANNLFVVWERL